ncbi:MAG: DUF5946 family protein [Acidimicrobiia bacterium]
MRGYGYLQNSVEHPGLNGLLSSLAACDLNLHVGTVHRRWYKTCLPPPDFRARLAPACVARRRIAISTHQRPIECPGCGIRLPTTQVVYTGYFNTSSECWDLFSEVQGVQYSNAMLARHAHQLTIDAYAAQHAGGDHPAKSVAIHLSGLHLVYDAGLDPLRVAAIQQRIATSTHQWPVFEVVPETRTSTIFEVAMAGEDDHVESVRSWSSTVWSDWAEYHSAIADLIDDAGVI